MLHIETIVPMQGDWIIGIIYPHMARVTPMFSLSIREVLDHLVVSCNVHMTSKA